MYLNLDKVNRLRDGTRVSFEVVRDRPDLTPRGKRFVGQIQRSTLDPYRVSIVFQDDSGATRCWAVGSWAFDNVKLHNDGDRPCMSPAEWDVRQQVVDQVLLSLQKAKADYLCYGGTVVDRDGDFVREVRLEGGTRLVLQRGEPQEVCSPTLHAKVEECRKTRTYTYTEKVDGLRHGLHVVVPVGVGSGCPGDICEEWSRGMLVGRATGLNLRK